jgi:hypothetical protein
MAQPIAYWTWARCDELSSTPRELITFALSCYVNDEAEVRNRERCGYDHIQARAQHVTRARYIPGGARRAGPAAAGDAGE